MDCPVTLLYVPGAHDRHTDCPTAGLNVPVEHTVHVVDCVGEYKPVPHGRHDMAPKVFVYVPAGQGMQEDSPNWLVSPNSPNLPAGQFVHCAILPSLHL